MSAPAARRALRQTIRSASRPLLRPSTTHQVRVQALQSNANVAATLPCRQSRWLSTSRPSQAGIMPESEDPQPPNKEAVEAQNLSAANLSDEEYHEIAEEYMDTLNEKAEGLQESRQDVEVEYAAGVLNIIFPPNGTYVINKQPPNKQIWLSSPLSGPKRYDWVVSGDGMHQKEGAGHGEWVYLRDGTRLNALLSKELGLGLDHQAEEELLKTASKDPVE